MTTCMKDLQISDSQRSTVYSWEQCMVAPFDRTLVELQNVQSIVNYVWQNEGLKYPPTVEPLPKQKKAAGDASRITVRFKDITYTWIILHELAHSMTSVVCDTGNRAWEGISNHHGSLFMGIYIQLLGRYMNFNVQKLMETAEQYGLHVKLDARPAFL